MEPSRQSVDEVKRVVEAARKKAGAAAAAPVRDFNEEDHYMDGAPGPLGGSAAGLCPSGDCPACAGSATGHGLPAVATLSALRFTASTAWAAVGPASQPCGQAACLACSWRQATPVVLLGTEAQRCCWALPRPCARGFRTGQA